MLQPTLLLELVLLAAIVYLFWQTRQLARRSAQSSAPQIDRLVERDAMELAQEMTDLLTDLQSVANVIRHEAQARQNDLHQVIDQAETAQDQLRTLVAQSDLTRTHHPFREGITVIDPAIPRGGLLLDLLFGSSRDQVTDQPAPLPRQPGKARRQTTFFAALDAFNSHLTTAGQNDRTITRIVSHVREFAIWLGGPYYDELRLEQVNAAKVAAYLSELEEQSVRPAALKRIKTSLEQFMEWVEQQPGEAQPAPVHQPADSSPGPVLSPPRLAVPPVIGIPYQPVPMLAYQADALTGHSRYQAVLQLAQQGLDRPSIAAQTGLAQEAIRMLLAREKVA